MSGHEFDLPARLGRESASTKRKRKAYALKEVMERAAFDIDLLAASLRADSSDVGAFVEGLAAKLEDLLPGRVKVQRGRRGMFGPKLVKRIALDAGGERLELVRTEGDAVETRLARISGGIVLKTEPLGTDAWLVALGEALSQEAARSGQIRQALERLLLN
ncbi:MAG: hypothetical protein WBP81_18440 [Solirubrobacteraceae bacterium]